VATVTSAKPAKEVVLQQLVAERQELIDFCRTLRPDEWNTPSLCYGWSVRDVLAHVIGVQKNVSFMLTSGTPKRANQRMVDVRKNMSTDELVRELESIKQPNFVAKLMPLIFLEDTWVHQQDMRWVLGAERQRRQDPDRMLLILNFLKKGVERKKGGFVWTATDVNWTAGEGEPIGGAAEAVIMALMKRPLALDRLSGSGVATLKERWKNRR
jgi:uncharacterized protein (TIGR03083 family)